MQREAVKQAAKGQQKGQGNTEDVQKGNAVGKTAKDGETRNEKH